MSRSQQYIGSLFERIPKAALARADQQSAFDQIREKLGTTSDILEELKTLYKVKDFSDLALGLMWIAEKVENDPSRLEPTYDEEALVFSMFQRAYVEGASAPVTYAPSAEPEAEVAPASDVAPTSEESAPAFDFPSAPPESTSQTSVETPAETPQGFDFPSQETPAVSPFDSTPVESLASSDASPSFDVFNAPPPAEQVPTETSGAPEVATFGSEASPPADSPLPADVPPVASAPAGSEQEHAALFEKFIEALQAGTEDRMALLDQLVQRCHEVAASDAPQEYKDYSQMLTTLLKSLTDNQMLDDVRAMNMLSAVLDPFSQWAKTDPGSRSGIIEPGVESLRGFIALFE